jgi:hypothetical protein
MLEAAAHDGFSHRRDEIDEAFQALVRDLVDDPGWAQMSGRDILIKINERGGMRVLMRQSLLLFELAEGLKSRASGVSLDLLRAVQARLRMIWNDSGDSPEGEVHEVVRSFAEAFSLWHELEIDAILE